MIESVKCRFQVRVQHPQAFGISAFTRLVDSFDRVVAATAGRNPYDLGSNRASHAGSNAFTARACNARSAITGIPSGRRRPLFFGTYTRLTGHGDHGLARCCTQSANSTLSRALTTTLPSTPAVVRPALISVTRRTLN